MISGYRTHIDLEYPPSWNSRTQSRDKKSSRITSFNGLAVLSYLAGEEGRLPGTGKKDVISRMIKRFDKAPRDGKNGENEQDRGNLVDLYASEGRSREEGETSGDSIKNAVTVRSGFEISEMVSDGGGGGCRTGLKSAVDGTGNFPSKAFVLPFHIRWNIARGDPAGR